MDVIKRRQNFYWEESWWKHVRSCTCKSPPRNYKRGSPLSWLFFFFQKPQYGAYTRSSLCWCRIRPHGSALTKPRDVRPNHKEKWKYKKKEPHHRASKKRSQQCWRARNWDRQPYSEFDMEWGTSHIYRILPRTKAFLWHKHPLARHQGPKTAIDRKTVISLASFDS